MVSCGPNSIQLTLVILYNIYTYNNHTMNSPKEFPPPTEFLHPVVKNVLVANIITDINTIHIVFVIIIDV